MLTPKQKQILDYFKKCLKKNGYSPSLEEAAKHFKSAKSTIHEHVEALIEKGYLNKTDYRARAIELPKTKKNELITIPLLGTIAAGQPIEAIKGRETIKVQQSLLSKSGEHFALKVLGDSMIEDGISDGDTVIIRKQPTAENGETAVAVLNGNEVTLKKIFKEKNGFRLQPANSSFKPIFTKELEIQGKVISVIRKFEDLKEKIISEKNEIKNYENNGKNGIFSEAGFNLNKIYNIDCLDLMKKIKNNSTDLIFSDPPYNLSKSNFKMKFSKSGGADLNTNKGKWDYFKNDDYEIFTRKWLEESFRILKENGSIWVAGSYHNIYMVGYIMQKIGFEILNEVLWHKSDATPNMSCTRFVADHENFIWARKGKKHTFNYDIMKNLNGGKQMRSLWTRGKTAGGKRMHPTQKPEWLLERIIMATSVPENIIFDPFMGSGTTAIMSKKLNRNFIGAEIDKEYYKKSIERLKNTNKCLTI